MNSQYEYAEKQTDKEQPKWKEFIWSLRKHLYQTFIVAVVAFFATYLFTEVNWENTQQWLRILTALAFTVTAELILATYLHLRDQAKTFQNGANELMRYRQECEHLNTENGRLETALQSFGKYFGLERRDEMISVLHGDGNDLSRELHSQHFRQQQNFITLLSGKPITVTYKDQHEYANILASKSQIRLWTTCVDLPADFQVRNYSYMDSLVKIPARLQRGTQERRTQGDPPATCRIFVGQSKDFFDDARMRYDKWIDLYKWHLKWGTGDADVAIRFLPVYSNRDYDELFRTKEIDIAESEIIHDFMIVDNRLVYGREITVASDNIHLHLNDQTFIVQKYDQLYRELWKQSITIYKLIDRLLQEQNSKELIGIKEQCVKAQSKLHIIADYGSDFPISDRTGIPFFNRVCALISQSERLCFAVDRAAKKAGSLWNSWNKTPYKEFLEASISAARSATTTFYRLFMLETKFPIGDREKVRDFINGFVANRIHVGFILREETGMPEITQRYDTDFIVVGYIDAMPEQANSFGFELQDEDFKPSELSMESNLIARERLAEHHRVFKALWDSPYTVAVHEARKEDVDNALNKLIEGEQNDEHM